MRSVTEIFYTISVLLAPALAVYNFLPGISLGAFLVLISSLLFFLTHGLKTISRENMFLLIVLFGLTFLETLINLFGNSSWFDFTLMIHNLFSVFICFFPLIVASKGINVNILIRGLLLLGLFASIVIIWQRATKILTGSFESNVFLPWFEVNREIETFSISRPSAFFTEPAHFCIFILPILYLSLLRRNHLFSLLFAFSILCSGSTTGFLAVIILLVYFVSQNSKGKDRARYLVLVFISGIAALFLIITLMPSIIIENLNKLQEFDSTSTSLRTLGYLSYFKDFGISEILFGVTLNQLVNYLHYTFRIDEIYNYSNAIVYMLMSYGIIGFLFFVRYLYRLWVTTPRTIRGFIILFLVILASDQILFNMHYLYIATLAMMSNQISNSSVKNTNSSKYLKTTIKI